MVETSPIHGPKIEGSERWKLLSTAEQFYVQGEWAQLRRMLDAFIDTIKEDSKPGKAIIQGWNKIEQTRQQQLKDLKEGIQDEGFLEQKDLWENQRIEIEIHARHSMLAKCWTVALSMGLFHEEDFQEEG